MEKYFDILYKINQGRGTSQRALASALGISVGRVNYLLKEMEAKGWLEKKEKGYSLTQEAMGILEHLAKGNNEQKLRFAGTPHRAVKTAVILAAGASPFPKPVGLLELKEGTVIERIRRMLWNYGIEKIILVAGDRKEHYEEFCEKNHIQMVVSDKYRWTGTMASLAAARAYIDGNFLLIEGNQIFEERAIKILLEAEEENAMILAAPNDSDDEAYVELDRSGNIFRISKDIKQLNRIDGELVGISKVSMELLDKMMEYYSHNKNPYLNYEYVIESIGRLYVISGIMVDDLEWTVIENEKLYERAVNIIYPMILKREGLAKENMAREIMKKALGIEKDHIVKVEIGGGMTNQNFLVTTIEKSYILRIPGACTQRMIDREREYHNSMEAVRLGLSPEIPYFDRESGVKVTDYIMGAKTLHPKSARLEVNMKKTTDILRTIHQGEAKLKGRFDPWEQYEIYRCLALENQGVWYEGSGEMEMYLYEIRDKLEALGMESKPCHNDLVAENFIEDHQGRMYLIDWEYAGNNDPMWDLAAHLLECGFTPDEEELFLDYYFQGEPTPEKREKIQLYKILQDILWSVWTIAKEASGEDFGSYGEDRMKRAMKERKKYEKTYE